MTKLMFLAVGILFAFSANAETLTVPGAKGSCSKFSFEGQGGWRLKSTRKKGGRWELRDKKGKLVARFDCGLANTDQKQLSEVEDLTLTLGGFEVEKLTVSLAPPQEGVRASDGLITSYSYPEGDLHGLIVMSNEYDASSGLDKIIEKALATVHVEKAK